MQSVSSDYFDYYFGWENSRYCKQLTELNSSYPNMLLSIGQSRLRRWRYYEHQLSFGEQERTLSLSQELMKRNRYTHVSCVHPCLLSSTLSLGL